MAGDVTSGSTPYVTKAHLADKLATIEDDFDGEASAKSRGAREVIAELREVYSLE